MKFNSYNDLINNVKLQVREKGHGTYYELHHIIPKNMGGLDTNDNRILLTVVEHVYAHYLLALECEAKGDHQHYIANIQSAYLIINGKSKFTASKRQEIINWLKDPIAQQLATDIKMKFSENRKKEKGPNAGKTLHIKDRIWAQKATQKPVRILEKNLGMGSWVGYIKIIDCPICHQPNSEESFACCEDHAKLYMTQIKDEYKKARAQQVKERWQDPEYAKRIIEANTGITHGHTGNWVTNGTESIMISDEELANYLSNGWVKGRSNIAGHAQTEEAKQKISERRKNSCYVYNDEVDCKEISKDQLEEYLANGWKKGKRVHYSRKGIKQPPMAWVHNDTEIKRIRKENLQEYLDNGWVKGRK